MLVNCFGEEQSTRAGSAASGLSLGQWQKANDPKQMTPRGWSASGHAPGRARASLASPELHLLQIQSYLGFINTRSGLGNLGNLVLSLIEVWGSVRFPQSPSHPSQILHQESSLNFPLSVPCQGSAGFVCSTSLCSKGFQCHVRQALEQLLLHFPLALYPWTEFPRLKSWKIDPGNLA